MSNPSAGLAIAWRIAASEAGAAGYTRIECAHLFMGLLSLDKANAKALKDLGFDPVQMTRVLAEEAAIRALFDPFSLSTRVLRRDLRSRVGKRPVRARGVMSRSTASKAAFARAELLADGKAMNALHLLTVLLREPDPAIASLMTDRRLGKDLADRAEAAAGRPFGAAPVRKQPTTRSGKSRESRPEPAKGEGAFAPAAEGAAGTAVDTRSVAEMPAEKRGLPLEIPSDGTGEGARLLKLEAHLKSKIVGQDDAVASVASRIKRAYAGPSERRGPLAVFLLIGPTGVGKTEMALTLARFLFGSADDLSRFEMSEYTEEPSVSRLIGSPPGQLDHAEPGQLTEAIRRRPYSVILFDRVEKAHPKVFDVFLQLFDTGRLTDAQGRVADGRNLIVVMTSNLGHGKVPAEVAFTSTETVPFTRAGQQKAELRKFFGPELLKRIDAIVSFRSLDESDVRRIARPFLAALIAKLRKTQGVFLRFEPEAESFVLRAGFDPEKGVREMKRAIERLVERPLSSLALSGKLAKHPAWKAVHAEGGLQFLPE